MRRARFVETLLLLAQYGVEFIIVGMTAGVLQGVPLSGRDPQQDLTWMQPRLACGFW